MPDVRNRAAYFVSWSGGKDACLAMSRLIAKRGRPSHILAMVDETGARSRGHHLRVELLNAQAGALGVSLVTRSASWETYEEEFLDALTELRRSGIAEGVFGDIDLIEHREWVETTCARAGIVPHEPLWLQGRLALLDEFIDSGHEAVLVAVKEGVLSAGLLGRRLDRSLVEEFVSAGIDPSGELGEYHTVVVDGPAFSRRIELEERGHLLVDGYRFLDVAPAG